MFARDLIAVHLLCLLACVAQCEWMAAGGVVAGHVVDTLSNSGGGVVLKTEVSVCTLAEWLVFWDNTSDG